MRRNAQQRKAQRNSTQDTSETIWQALYLAVLLDAVAAVIRNLRKFSRNSSPESPLLPREQAKTEANLMIRSEEAVRRWKSKRGVRAAQNAARNSTGDEERRAASSLSLRIWVACEVLTSSKTFVILTDNFRFSSDSPIAIVAFQEISDSTSFWNGFNNLEAGKKGFIGHPDLLILVQALYWWMWNTVQLGFTSQCEI